MKKILFCAAVVTLAAACTNEDDLVMNQDNSRAKGLTFDVTLAEGATTRGEISKDENGKYPFFWYAEDDRINVYAINVTAADGKNTQGLGTATYDDGTGVWTLGSNGPSAYKATKSSGVGQFTAANDVDWLQLKDYDAKDVAGTTATIVATYGEIKASAVTSEIKSTKAIPGKLTSLVLKTTVSNAAQTVARANAVAAPMYSVSTGAKEESYNSLGEKANLKLLRLFPTVRFTTKNTKDYITDFGKLKSVELSTLGDKASIGATTASILAYDQNKDYTVIGNTVGFAAGYDISSNSEKVKVTLTDGTWTDDDAVYMTVAPVDRKAYRTGNKKELLKVIYEFDKITFTLDASSKDATAFEKEFATSNDWTATDKDGNPNAVTPLPALDINNYSYLVTNESSNGSNDRTLIVLKGDFKNIFSQDGTKVIWGGAEVAVAGFSKIISNVELSDDELATLKKFTALKDLTLKENTSIPANTFTAAQATAITALNLPKVTSIEDKFINGATSDAFAALKSLIMPAYTFESVVVNKAFFNDAVKAKLVTIDMSGVTSMMPTFGIERTMTFKDYAALEEVTVKDDVVVSPSGFAGCKVLRTITGKLDITQAPSVFDMNAEANRALVSVEVTGTEIPNNAFNNCTALKTVKYNGSTVIPTAIGASAFATTTAMKHMDLSKAVTIGANAFKASGITSTNDKVTTLIVGATELPASVFENCTGLKMVKFTNATKITGADIFKGATAVTQIKFEKVITLADIANGGNDAHYDGVFATPTKIDFWTNPSQPGVEGNSFTLSFKIGSVLKTATYAFKSIQKKLD